MALFLYNLVKKDNLWFNFTKDRDGHGDEFKSHMNRINSLANTSITIYHSFHDEVNACRQHIWRCTGACRTMKPFYGYVKRSMNRAPSKNDRWWADHQSKCQGKFEKVSEPDSYKQKMLKKNIKAEKKLELVKEENKKIIVNGNLMKKKAHMINSSQSTNQTKSIDSFFKLGKPSFEAKKENASPNKLSTEIKPLAIEFTDTFKSSETFFPLGSQKSPVKPNISKQIDKESPRNSKLSDTLFGKLKSPIKPITSLNSKSISTININKQKDIESPTKSKSSDTLFPLGKQNSPFKPKSHNTSPALTRLDSKQKAIESPKQSYSYSNSSVINSKIKSESSTSPVKKRKSDDIISLSEDEDKFTYFKDFKKNRVVVRTNEIIILDDDIPNSLQEKAECPVCGQQFFTDLINSHVNSHF